MSEKDTFGDKLRQKERAEEDQYFAKRDLELLEKLRDQDEAGRKATALEIARDRCPKCGKHLTTNTLDEITVETCSSCRGVWLNQNEVAAVSRRESESWLARLFRHVLIHTR